MELDLPIQAARCAQQQWHQRPIEQRLDCIAKLRHHIADSADTLATLINTPFRCNKEESLSAEILPLADACQFLLSHAKRSLKPNNYGFKYRPLWLFGNRIQIQHDPWGLILLIGPSNYPLFLLGVQLIQAITAGNAVIIKPGEFAQPVIQKLVSLCKESGIPEQLIILLDERVESAKQALTQDIDKVILTGSLSTGKQVLQQLAERVIPATVELSGCDAVIVQDNADLDLVAKSLIFGLTLNKSATCIAPRKIYASPDTLKQLENQLIQQLDTSSSVTLPGKTITRLQQLIETATANGFQLCRGNFIDENTVTPFVLRGTHSNSDLVSVDLFAPITTLLSVDDIDQAVTKINQYHYRLAVSIFGEQQTAKQLAKQLNVAIVVINNMIAPTADPRAPFGGRGHSGYGTTRGEAGLLEMTQLKTVITHHGNWRPHLQTKNNMNHELMLNLIKLLHTNSLPKKLSALWRLSQLGYKQSREKMIRRSNENKRKLNS